VSVEKYISVILSHYHSECETVETVLKKKYVYAMMMAKLEVLYNVLEALTTCKSMNDIEALKKRLKGAFYDLLDWMRIFRLEYDSVTSEISGNKRRIKNRIVAKYC